MKKTSSLILLLWKMVRFQMNYVRKSNAWRFYQIHVLSDMEAHCTVVPEARTTTTKLADDHLGNKFYVGDFNDISQFRNAVQNGFLRFVDIKHYMVERSDGTRNSSKYEDNRYFYPYRYEDADIVVNNTMVSLFDKSRTFLEDCLCAGGDPKLYKFKTYVYEAYNNDISSDNVWNINQMTIGD